MHGRRRALRALVFTGCWVAGFSLGVWGIVTALEAAGLGSPAINFNIVDILHRRLPALSEEPPGEGPSPLRLVVLGDSTVVSYPRGRQVHQALERQLARLAPEGPAVEVISLAVSGVAAFDYFFLADEIAAARPDGVIFSFNLDTLSEDWRNAYARPELAGRIAPGRIPEASALPLHWIGLTYDRFLYSVAVVQAGAYGLWYDLMFEQARVGRARKATRDWIGAAAGSSADADFDQATLDARLAHLFGPARDVRRFSQEGELVHYGAALSGIRDDHPVLLAFAGTLAAFERAQIPVFVYLTPTNVDHMRTLGVFDAEGLEKTIERIERASEANGAEFLDLHALLPDGAFRDAAGHFTVGELFDGPALLAEALAPALLEHIRARRGAQD